MSKARRVERFQYLIQELLILGIKKADKQTDRRNSIILTVANSFTKLK